MNMDDWYTLRPAFVQLIKSALCRGEDVDKDIAVIEEHPAGIGGTFPMQRPDAFLFQGLFNFVTNGSDLAFTIGGADDKIIGESATLTHIQQNNV